MPKRFREDLFEPDRKELAESPANRFELDRRKWIAVAGAGLLVTAASKVVFSPRIAAAKIPPSTRLHLGEDGSIIILTSKVEVGQGSRTEILQAAAEELRVTPESLQVMLADTAVTPDDGSTTGGRLAYADLARSKRLTLTDDDSAPRGVPLTEIDDWTVLGRALLKTKARELVTGAHRYPSDIVRSNMLYGAVLRPPSYGAQLESVDLTPSKELGVVAIRDGGFVGCAAKTSYKARNAVEAIGKTAKWRRR